MERRVSSEFRYKIIIAPQPDLNPNRDSRWTREHREKNQNNFWGRERGYSQMQQLSCITDKKKADDVHEVVSGSNWSFWGGGALIVYFRRRGRWRD